MEFIYIIIGIIIILLLWRIARNQVVIVDCLNRSNVNQVEIHNRLNELSK